MEFYNELNPAFRHCFRDFVNHYFNGSLIDLLEEENLTQFDYLSILIHEPSLVEQAFVIWANNIEFDEEGEVLTHQQAKKRAAQYIASVCVPGYIVNPDFEGWEVELM